MILFPGHAVGLGKCKRIAEEKIRGYAVQFEFPVENPVNNVRRTMRNGFATFVVPVNFPDLHKLTLAELLMLSLRREQSTGINNP